ncbi:hypothetical protein TBLA_0B03000 [Henningerozyma blattae CBS 6284]|uniref:Uncharacterized protein n=1 Tax=Henningerozyma blattae (strain ATCC 34711 / CBS 6284 / DSM 70876 / NBRC 10599 / NRRL Y-10934 / UCD 77-7) TaxID=1071380 RepID=I2GYE0_HENB6|nr:hypothetical protein TBLA_0B03000 [Tetrapisispora blattae CBS 6284]CCH59142.1 hypothetical protein TBLA_0B03000 [Tetrapisispora blattae CBS 6284]
MTDINPPFTSSEPVTPATSNFVPTIHLSHYTGPTPRFRSFSNLKLTEHEENELVDSILVLDFTVPLSTILGLNKRIITLLISHIKPIKHATEGPHNNPSNTATDPTPPSAMSINMVMINALSASPEKDNDQLLLENTRSAGPLLYVPIEINNQRISNCLIDAESKVNIISTTISDVLKLPLIPTQHTGWRYNGLNTFFDYKTNILFKMDSTTFTATFYVFPHLDTCQALLCSALLTSYGIFTHSRLEPNLGIQQFNIYYTVPFTTDRRRFSIPLIVPEEANFLDPNLRLNSTLEQLSTSSLDTTATDLTIPCIRYYCLFCTTYFFQS